MYHSWPVSQCLKSARAMYQCSLGYPPNVSKLYILTASRHVYISYILNAYPNLLYQRIIYCQYNKTKHKCVNLPQRFLGHASETLRYVVYHYVTYTQLYTYRLCEYNLECHKTFKSDYILNSTYLKRYLIVLTMLKIKTIIC